MGPTTGRQCRGQVGVCPQPTNCMGLGKGEVKVENTQGVGR